MLAEGDVDPAAGSRDEPTRLHVEDPVAEREQAFEAQVTRSLFLKSNKWVQALPPTPKDRTILGPGVTPKHDKKQLKNKGHQWRLKG